MRNRSVLPIAAFGRRAGVVCLALLAVAGVRAQEDFRGLWVGQVSLKYVTEVTTPLNANNVPIAPNPMVPTPTADEAQLRVLLHVNGAGQVTLLRDVAILNRNATSNRTGVMNALLNKDALQVSISGAAIESDVALITDERLYAEFPAQPATRLATVGFDFGDRAATDAVDAIARAAALAAGNSVFANPGPYTNQAGRTSALATARLAGLNAATPLLPKADVSAAFSAFLSTYFKSATVDAIAGAANPATAAATARIEAEKLRTNSFYLDARAVNLVDGVVAAVVAARTAGGNPTNAAHHLTAAYADVANDYHRFIAGKQFGDMILTAAAAAAAVTTNAGVTAGAISNAVTANDTVNAARSEALRRQVSAYRDQRASQAVEIVINTIITNVVASLPPVDGRELIRLRAQQAAFAALSDAVPRFPIPGQTPTTDYDLFVRSATYQGSAATAAQAAAEAAVTERAGNALYTEQSLRDAALAAAIEALDPVYDAAARAQRTELPLEAGAGFGPGRGDARLRWDIQQTNGPALSPIAGLTGTVVLPANHPTNPFRHRRHPDHTVGFNITRQLRLDFDGTPGEPLPRAGFGVERLSGTYREEVFGLHKPLGPNRDVGLRVEGKFQLNRVSRIDTLNAR